MRTAGAILVVWSFLIFGYLGLIARPQPELFCGDRPAVVVALVGYEPTEGWTSIEDGCRLSAVRQTAIALVLSGGVFSTAVAVLIGASQTHDGVGTRRRQRPPGPPLSLDGSLWFDGRRWHPVAPGGGGAGPGPAGPLDAADDGDDAGPG